VRLIVGLGNPGIRYQRTRHNAGYMAIDELARGTPLVLWSVCCQSLTLEAALGTHRVVLAKPLTFMNRSGPAVRLLLEVFRIDPKEMVLILDDLNLPLGRIRIRERGSSGGHNGLESVIETLNSDEILRVRLGIGEDDMPEDKSGFVLSDFPPSREAELKVMITKAAQAVNTLLDDGVTRAMSVFNA
jgi:PTH1 family peptidyl-tRNA hydrolase